MKVTSVEVYKLSNPALKIKANGKVQLDGCLTLAFTIIDIGKGPFISWKGTEEYTDKQTGKKKYASPIMFGGKKDEDNTLGKELEKTVTTEILNAYKSNGQRPSKGGSEGPSFTGDEIPF